MYLLKSTILLILINLALIKTNNLLDEGVFQSYNRNEEAQIPLINLEQQESYEYVKQSQRNLQRTFDSTYKCGECLYYGYKSCIGKSYSDHRFMSSYSKTDTTLNLCCQWSQNCQDASHGWSCSSYYNNTVYAKYTCPFNTAVCGTKDIYNITAVGGTANLTMTMARGEVCFYKIMNSCGRAKVDLLQVDNSASILIEFMEFEKGEIMLGSEYIHGKTGGAPNSSMPWRTETFVYDENRKVYQGRLYYGQGPHYWGGYTQNLASNLPSGSSGCADRYTYLIVTSLTDTTSTVKIGIEAVTYDYAFTLSPLSLSLISALLLMFILV